MSGIDYSKRSPDGLPEKWRSVDFTSISDSEIEELVEDIYKANASINLSIPLLPETIAEFFKTFLCRRCGTCCVGGGDGIFLSPDDIERLSTAMQLSKRRFKDRFTFINHGRRLLPYPCPFYDSESHLCTVYQARPSVCRLFPLNNPIIEKGLYSSADGVRMLTVSTCCPEGRRIACQFIKMQRDVLSFCEKLDKSKTYIV